MASPAGRRLRPLAVLCALLMIAWGAASTASLVVQIMDHNDFGWPDENADGEVWAYVLLYLSAAASGVWVAIWGLFGLAWRPPLHLAAVSLLVAIGFEVAANAVQVSYFSDLGAPLSLGDQAEWYVDRVTFDTGGRVASEGRAFVTALPLTTALVPLVAWLVVLVSGAGRKRRPAASGQPQQYPPQQYPPQHQQPQQYPPHPSQQQAHPPAYPPPPPPQPRVAWQQVPPVVRPGRGTPPPGTPPDREKGPSQNPPAGS